MKIKPMDRMSVLDAIVSVLIDMLCSSETNIYDRESARNQYNNLGGLFINRVTGMINGLLCIISGVVNLFIMIV